MLDWPIERLIFVKRYVLSSLPLVGTSMEIYEAGDKVVQALRETKTQCEANNDHLSEKQKTTLSNLIATQAAISISTVEIGSEVIETLKKIVALRTFLDGSVRPLTARLTAARVPVADAFPSEDALILELAVAAETSIANCVSVPTHRSAESDVKLLEKQRASIHEDVMRRASALAEMGAAALGQAAKKLGAARLTDLVAHAHPPVAALLDESTVSLDDLSSVLDGALGGNVAMLSDLLENGCNRDPAKIKDIATAFPPGSPEQTNLADMIAAGGFADHPAALGPVFAIGCHGDPTELKTLANAFKDGPDQQKLKSLLDKAGLGAAPEALGHVIAHGGATQVLALGTEFSSDDDLMSLNDMITNGGLGGATARSPDALAMMLQYGVSGPDKLKSLHDDFGSDGMDDMRAMIAALDLRPPDDRNPGAQFAHVAAKVGAPPANLKTDFFDVLDKSARGSAARSLVKGGAQNADIDAMLQATSKAADPATTAARDVAFGGAIALAALQGIAGIDPATQHMLENSVAALGKAAVSAQTMSELATDPTAAQNAQSKLRESLSDPTDIAAYGQAEKQAKTEAEAAKVGAEKAAHDLNQADPKTKLLIDTAEHAAAEAVAKATVCPDDKTRADTLIAAKTCLDAINVAVAAVTSAAMAEAKTHAKTASLAASSTAQPTCVNSADLYDDLKEAKKDLAAQVAAGVVSPALDPFTQAAQLAENKYANRASNRGAILALSDSADDSAQVALAAMIVNNPTLAAGQAEAARLAKLAAADTAADSGRLAVLIALGDATAALTTQAIADATTAVGALESPSAAPQTIRTVLRSDGAALYEAAISLKAAVSAALSCREARLEALRAQITIAKKASDLKDMPGATDPERQAAVHEGDEVTRLTEQLKDAQTALNGLVSRAKALDKRVNKNVKIHIKHFKDLGADGAVSQDDKDAQETQMKAAQQAAVICALIAKRSYSASYPPMSRDDLIATASTMEKADSTALSASEPIGGGTKAEADILHFCGRHTREYFGFEGRDFFDEDLLTDEAIARAVTGNTKFDFPLNQMKTTSLWPPGFSESDVKSCVELAIAALNAKPDVSAAGSLRAYLDTQGGNKQFKGISINHNGDPFTVTIAVRSKGAATDDPNIEIGQFVPTSTPSVPFYDMHAIKAAMKF